MDVTDDDICDAAINAIGHLAKAASRQEEYKAGARIMVQGIFFMVGHHDLLANGRFTAGAMPTIRMVIDHGEQLAVARAEERDEKGI
jgi:tRNA(Arg) A34 adenosine deaminase TadA